MAIRYADELPAAADLVIIGGGVVGAATAFFAARAGLRALVLERRPALATLTTAVATGGFRLQFDTPHEMALMRESVAVFEHFAEATRQRLYDPHVRQQGYLFATTDPGMAERQRRVVERQRGWGQADIEILDGPEVKRRFPFLAPDVIQARFRQGDGFLDPRQVAHGLAEGSGAAFATGCEVTGLMVSGGRVAAVVTNKGRVSTRNAVIAAGPFSGAVAALAGITLPIAMLRRHKLVLPDLPLVPPDAPMTIDDDSGVHWRPALRGAYLLYTDPTTHPTPPADTIPVGQDFAFALLDPASPTAACRIAPFWREVWEHRAAQWMTLAGQYTMTPDHLPLIGPSAVDGLWVNTGYSGHGIMGSPAGSRLLVDLVAGRGAAANPFRLDRELIEREIGSL
jgi:sarcosine oxidase, subunit beta